MAYALKLDTNGNITRIYFPDNRNFNWFAHEIGCEWIEIVRPRGYNDLALVVDEEGFMNGRRFNPYASLMYGVLEHGQPIVGTALLVKEGIVNGEPDLIGLTEKEVDETVQMLDRMRDKIMEEQND